MTTINFPESIDNDDNLYEVHDLLRVSLIKDYNPGDTTIYIDGDPLIISQFPQVGIITLTDQCLDIDDRAISFYYSSVDEEELTINGLELLPGFEDVKKFKKITNVTQNVMADHHNVIKDALVAVQHFVGKKGIVDVLPFGETMEGRINFLRKLVLVPKAWFVSDIQTGIVPLEVEFTDKSFRLGTDGTAGEVTLTWDFGDQTSSIVSMISVTDEVSEGDINVIVRDEDGKTIRKTYLKPGKFDVKLTVSNDFGEDECIFTSFINARVKAPNEAVIRINEDPDSQTATPGDPVDGPFDVVPKVKAPTNSLIEFQIESGENFATPGYSFGGEALDSEGNPLDAIDTYTWGLGDDLSHPNSPTTKASFSIGGIYDLKLRVDTEFGAYRITTYEDCINIIESTNLWLWLFSSSNIATAYEYGLISETFKAASTTTLNVSRDDSFLDDVNSSDQQKQEFNRNTGFSPRGSITSGRKGSALLYWASGRTSSESPSLETINISEFIAFDEVYISRTGLERPWNWVGLHSGSKSFFVFGSVEDTILPYTSPTNNTLFSYDLPTLTNTSSTLLSTNMLSGASELLNNIGSYDEYGSSVYGNFSVYRSSWKDSTGYFLRNDGIGPFLRIKSFYKTEGVVSSPFQSVRKIQDIQGPTRLEGQLTNLSQGVYFINNSGSISMYSPTTSIWTTGGPGINSATYRNLQDTTVEGFDDGSNTLLLASDSDKRAYISFDYSSDAFLKFSEVDITFKKLGSRPEGDQWLMGVY